MAATIEWLVVSMEHAHLIYLCPIVIKIYRYPPTFTHTHTHLISLTYPHAHTHTLNLTHTHQHAYTR